MQSGRFLEALAAEDCASTRRFFSSGCNGGQISTPWSYIKSHGVVTGNYNGTGSMGGGYCSAFSLPHCHRERDDQTAS